MVGIRIAIRRYARRKTIQECFIQASMGVNPCHRRARSVFSLAYTQGTAWARRFLDLSVENCIRPGWRAKGGGGHAFRTRAHAGANPALRMLISRSHDSDFTPQRSTTRPDFGVRGATLLLSCRTWGCGQASKRKLRILLALWNGALNEGIPAGTEVIWEVLGKPLIFNSAIPPAKPCCVRAGNGTLEKSAGG